MLQTLRKITLYKLVPCAHFFCQSAVSFIVHFFLPVSCFLHRTFFSASQLFPSSYIIFLPVSCFLHHSPLAHLSRFSVSQERTPASTLHRQSPDSDSPAHHLIALARLISPHVSHPAHHLTAVARLITQLTAVARLTGCASCLCMCPSRCAAPRLHQGECARLGPRHHPAVPGPGLGEQGRPARLHAAGHQHGPAHTLGHGGPHTQPGESQSTNII